MIQKTNQLSIKTQCELLSVSRRSYYYKSKGESEINRKIIKLIQEQYQKDPTCGSRRITAYLRKKGYRINRKRIQRLMRKMGIKAIYSKPKISIPLSKNTIDTHNLIKDISIRYPNQVWYTDITYIKLPKGYCYSVAVMDAYSKKILSIKHSNTLDRHFCVEAAKEAIRRYGYPEIIHSDRGAQFLSKEFIQVFSPFTRNSYTSAGFRDNIYIERFFRTYKHECLALYEFRNIKEVREITKAWISYYNTERLHQALGYNSPDAIYYGLQYPTVNGNFGVQYLGSTSFD